MNFPTRTGQIPGFPRLSPTAPGASIRAVGRLLPIALIACAGCAAVVFNRPGGPDIDFMTRAEFRLYTEAVFRLHNRVHSDLMMLIPDLESSHPEHYLRLIRAEQPMLEACHPLNDAVARYVEGGEIGFFKRLRLPINVTDCERETRRVEILLDLAMGAV